MERSEGDEASLYLPDRGKAIVSGIRIINRMIGELHRADVPYCHWKSNEHLRAGMLGLTDLDVLVDRNASSALNQILNETGFKRFAPTPHRAYPAVEDYIALDPETGRLAHLHLHYQLTLGAQHTKEYRLPWESLVLSTRQLDVEEDVYIADPHVEIALLLVRAALKIRTRDHLFTSLGRLYFQGEMLREFYWLKQRVQTGEVVELARDLLGEKSAGLLGEMMADQPTFRQLVVFRNSMKHILRMYRTFVPAGAKLRRWLRELYWYWGLVNRKCLHQPIPFSRTNPRGGLIVVFLGADGSGKSTVVRETVKCFSRKIDVVPIYFGSGDGPGSVFRRFLRFGLRFLNKIRKSGRNNVHIPRNQKRDHPRCRRLIQCVKAVAKPLWALVLVCEKRRKLCRAWQARNRGMLVIGDRYPQSQVMGFSDGPLLSRWLNHRSRLRRAAAHWEHSSYQLAEVYPPDLVVKLHVSLGVALQRKQDMGPEEIHRRVEAVKSLQYPPETKIVDVDADASLDQVLLKVKRVIWERM
jgi:thymidylate kinase